MDMAAVEPKYSGVDYKADETESEVSMALAFLSSRASGHLLDHG
jgi:hypothetical protein